MDPDDPAFDFEKIFSMNIILINFNIDVLKMALNQIKKLQKHERVKNFKFLSHFA